MPMNKWKYFIISATAKKAVKFGSGITIESVAASLKSDERFIRQKNEGKRTDEFTGNASVRSWKTTSH